MRTKNTLFEKIRFRKNNKKKCEAVINRVRRTGARVGENTALYDVHIDDNFPFLLRIGNNVTITGATILCHDASPLIFTNNILVGTVEICDNCFIGHGSILLPGVKIGPNSIVGAGSVVTGDIEPNIVAGGVPAKKIRRLDNFLQENAQRDGWIEWNMEKVPEQGELMAGIQRVYRLLKRKWTWECK